MADVGVVDPDGGAGLIYYAEYRLNADLNAALELVLKDTATVAGFRASDTRDGAPHQCPLDALASIYADMLSILMVMLAFKGYHQRCHRHRIEQH